MSLYRARERAIIARLMIELIKSVHKGRLGGVRVRGSISGEVEMLLIAAAVLTGEAEHRPRNAAEISRIVGIPRPTVQRKLVTLARRSAVERLDGNRYIMADHNPAGEYSYVDDALRLIRDAARNSSGGQT